MKPHREGDLDITQDLRHERVATAVERIGWIVMFALIAAGLAGLFGGGPVSRTAYTGRDVIVSYERFQRRDASELLELEFSPGAVQANGMFGIEFGREFFDRILIERIDPVPVHEAVESDRYVLSFSSAGSGFPRAVAFRYRPLRTGRLPVKIRFDGGGSAEFSVFVYP